jgi:hypothetical protein
MLHIAADTITAIALTTRARYLRHPLSWIIVNTLGCYGFGFSGSLAATSWP